LKGKICHISHVEDEHKENIMHIVSSVSW